MVTIEDKYLKINKFWVELRISRNQNPKIIDYLDVVEK